MAPALFSGRFDRSSRVLNVQAAAGKTKTKSAISSEPRRRSASHGSSVAARTRGRADLAAGSHLFDLDDPRLRSCGQVRDAEDVARGASSS